MQLEQSFSLPFPRALAWDAFKDIAMLVSCLPGAALGGAADAEPLEIVFAVKLGPIAASFNGQGNVAYDDATYSGSFSGSGADRKTNSRVKGEAKFSLAETAEGTQVSVLVDYALTGSLAQFSRGGIVKELAASITQQFAANLRARIAAAHAASAPAQAGTADGATAGSSPSANATTTSPSAPPAAPVALDAGNLVWRVLWARIKRLFGAG
jgi:carbon monoxide dehydrogenase subunit G